MKNRRFTQTFLTFAAGVMSGILLIGIYSFTIETPDSTPQMGSTINPVPVGEAHDMFLRYYNSAQAINERLKGFSVNRDEFSAIQTLFSKDPSLVACRIYLGKDRTQNDVRIVVGVNSNGLDDVSSGVYQTDSGSSDPCPHVCDVASPISKE